MRRMALLGLALVLAACSEAPSGGSAPRSYEEVTYELCLMAVQLARMNGLGERGGPPNGLGDLDAGPGGLGARTVEPNGLGDPSGRGDGLGDRTGVPNGIGDVCARVAAGDDLGEDVDDGNDEAAGGGEGGASGAGGETADDEDDGEGGMSSGGGGGGGLCRRYCAKLVDCNVTGQVLERCAATCEGIVRAAGGEGRRLIECFIENDCNTLACASP